MKMRMQMKLGVGEEKKELRRAQRKAIADWECIDPEKEISQSLLFACDTMIRWGNKLYYFDADDHTKLIATQMDNAERKEIEDRG